MCNTLHPSYETIYNAFSGQDVLPTFRTIVARLIQEETRISTHTASSMLQPKQMPWRWKCKLFLHMGRLHPIMEVRGVSSSNHESNNYQPSTSRVAQHGNHNALVLAIGAVVGDISWEIVMTWRKSLWSAPRVITNMVVHNLVKRYTLSTSFHS
jgi:hypothetical protein